MSSISVLNYKKQISFYIVASLLVGLISNVIRTDAIPWISPPLKVVENADDALLILSDPQIREINLDMAKSFHEKGLLFVDARAEEYLAEGMIPGAIANDDVGMLSEQIEYLLSGVEKGFVIYCSDDDCGSSEELAYELQDFGFMNIFVFTGGWKSWTEAGLDTEVHE